MDLYDTPTKILGKSLLQFSDEEVSPGAPSRSHFRGGWGWKTP